MDKTNLELLLNKIGPAIAGACNCSLPCPQLIPIGSDRKIIEAIALREEREFISASKPFITESALKKLFSVNQQQKLLFGEYAPLSAAGQILSYSKTIFYDESLPECASVPMLAHELCHNAMVQRHPFLAVLKYFLLTPEKSNNPLLPYEHSNASRLFRYFSDSFAETMSAPAVQKF
ncbi:MAG: hypothetical protein Q7K43_01720, partial [Candidatus Woesearchaeota archaeon]|nr:hypothetical protein [Candidatus Woesearchaeota archaeon]